MGDVDDVHMQSQSLQPMSLDISASEGEDDQDLTYSGDESIDDEDVRELSDDVDAFPFAKLYYRLIGKNQERAHSKPEAQPPKKEPHDKHEYNFTYPQRGLAVIINNEKFKPQSEMSVRHGSFYDATDLEQVFKRMGFKVKRYDDMSAQQMVLKLKKIAANLKYDHTQADCFACAILSHGDAVEIDPDKPPYDVRERQDVVFGVDGGIIPTKYILSLFNDRFCPELEGKPRLFFIQACRGTEYDDGQEIKVWKTKKKTGSKKRPHDKDHGDGTDSVPLKRLSGEPVADTMSQDLMSDACPEAQDDCDAGHGLSDITISPSPIYKDFLVMYSSPPGFFAWRRMTGAWFIQSLKKVIMTSDLAAVSLMKLLTKVSRRVALVYESSSNKEQWKHSKKQVPCIMSMLTKDVYFRPKK